MQQQPVREWTGDKTTEPPLPVDRDARDVRYGAYAAIAWGIVMIWVTSNTAADAAPGAVVLAGVVIAAIAGVVAWGINRRDRTAAGVFLALTAIGARADLLPPKLPGLVIDLALVYLAFRTARVIFSWHPRRVTAG